MEAPPQDAECKLKVGCFVESLMRVDVLRAELAVLSSRDSS
jgi:hypothetical protein